MTKDKLENLANELANCTKALLRIVEALENGMESRLEETEKVIPERKVNIPAFESHPVSS